MWLMGSGHANICIFWVYQLNLDFRCFIPFLVSFSILIMSSGTFMNQHDINNFVHEIMLSVGKNSNKL